jgi:hypothetical protein
MAYAKINSIEIAALAKIGNVAKAGFGKIVGVDVPCVAIDGVSNSKSIAFDGTNDHMTNAGNLTLDLGTYALWVKNTGGNGTYGMQTVFYVTGFFSMSLLFQLGTMHPSVTHPAAGTVNGLGVVDYSDDEWHFVAWTISGGGSGTENTLKLYSDGVLIKTLVATQTYPSSRVTAPIILGRMASCCYYTEANVDEVGIWSSALDADAIKQLYNCGAPIDLSSDSGNYNASGDLTHWWRMGDGDTHPTIEDAEGSYDLTMTNMASGDIEDEVPS